MLMKTNKLSGFTIAELTKQKAMLKGLLIGGAIVALVLYTVLIYLIIKNGKTSLIAVMPCGILFILPGIMKWNQIEAELKSRRTK